MKTSTPTALADSSAEGVAFIDTNILVYAHDSSETIKQPVARAVLEGLWDSGRGALSTQVLQEFYAVTTRKSRPSMSPAEAREIVSLYGTWSLVVIEPPLILTASRLHERGHLSFWDALIIEAAKVAGATRLLTEDLADGQEFDGLIVANPFAARG